MKAFAVWVWLGTVAVCASAAQGGAGVERDAELLNSNDWRALGLITGFHSIQNKKAGFDARLLEADGSATVAWDPVALFLVVRSGETPDSVAHTWRLPRGVARVRSFAATSCGAAVRVDIDRIISGDQVRGTVPRTLRLCFLGSDGKPQERLRVSETP